MTFSPIPSVVREISESCASGTASDSYSQKGKSVKMLYNFYEKRNSYARITSIGVPSASA